MSINDYGIIRDNIREFGTLENVKSIPNTRVE